MLRAYGTKDGGFCPSDKHTTSNLRNVTLVSNLRNVTLVSTDIDDANKRCLWLVHNGYTYHHIRCRAYTSIFVGHFYRREQHCHHVSLCCSSKGSRNSGHRADSMCYSRRRCTAVVGTFRTANKTSSKLKDRSVAVRSYKADPTTCASSRSIAVGGHLEPERLSV
ncbi:hypothetical protein TNCV_3839131 [Trichonephila clavipes]|nr:hypothetical protein TNCV_3839131 [Trichonephila clavipes]